MFGDISGPRPLGNINNTGFTFSSLTITGNQNAYNSLFDSLIVYGNSFLAGSVLSKLNTLDDGSSGCTFGNSGAASVNIGNASAINTILGTTNINNSGTANTNINTVGGTLTIGTTSTFGGNGGHVLLLSGSANGGNFAVLQNVTGTNSMTFGNDTGPTTFNTHGTININTSGSSNINIGTGTYTGTVSIGGNAINITGNSTAGVSIGNGLNTVYIGSQGGSNSIVNIQPGTGSNTTNICASTGYSGTLTIGNTSIGAINFIGSGANGINSTVQTSGYPFIGNVSAASSNVFTLLKIAGTPVVAYGWQNGLGIGIYDQVHNQWWLGQGTGTAGYVATYNSSNAVRNVLDDGAGGCSFATSGSAAVNIGTGTYTGTITLGNSSAASIACNTSFNITSPAPVPFVVNGTSVGNTVAMRLQVNGTTQYTISCTNGTGSFGIQNSSGADFLKQSSSNALSLLSANNTLDDGSGVITINYSTEGPGLMMNETTTGWSSYTRYSNTVSGRNCYVGLDGAGLANADPGALWLSTDGTGSKPIYLSAANSLTWGLKVQTTAVIGGLATLTNRTGTSYNTTTTISAADVIKGIVYVPSGTGAITLTMPTPSSIYTALGLTTVTGHPCFHFKLVTLSTNNVTLGAGTGWTVFTSNQTGNHNTLNFEIELTSSTTATMYGG